MTNWAQMYRECNADAIALVESLTPEQLDARVPATPEWSLHQLAAHLVGTASDAVTGRMDGAPSPVWTARHVAEREGWTAGELAAEMRETEAAVIEAMAGNERPALIWDRSVHLADFFEALGLGRPAEERWLPLYEAVGPWRLADLPTIDASPYELVRAVFSRRSRAQIRAWNPDLTDSQIESIGVFGTRDDDQPVPEG
ncbi:MAG: DinB family protein [Propionibacteriaceae bacterium]